MEICWKVWAPRGPPFKVT